MAKEGISDVEVNASESLKQLVATRIEIEKRKNLAFWEQILRGREALLCDRQDLMRQGLCAFLVLFLRVDTL